MKRLGEKITVYIARGWQVDLPDQGEDLLEAGRPMRMEILHTAGLEWSLQAKTQCIGRRFAAGGFILRRAVSILAPILQAAAPGAAPPPPLRCGS